jgi:hypothetical protein
VTTTSPILTGPPPTPPVSGVVTGLGSCLPPVAWCKAMLEWCGWTVRPVQVFTQPDGNLRVYPVLDGGGVPRYYSTHGLRQTALDLWWRYGNTPKNFTSHLTTPNP